jgi:hypothetical protein
MLCFFLILLSSWGSVVRLVYGWLSVCLLLFVGACCLVSVVWRCPGGMYVAGCFSAGCRSEIGVRIYISYYALSVLCFCGDVPQALYLILHC